MHIFLLFYENSLVFVKYTLQIDFAKCVSREKSIFNNIISPIYIYRKRSVSKRKKSITQHIPSAQHMPSAQHIQSAQSILSARHIPFAGHYSCKISRRGKAMRVVRAITHKIFSKFLYFHRI